MLSVRVKWIPTAGGDATVYVLRTSGPKILMGSQEQNSKIGTVTTGRGGGCVTIASASPRGFSSRRGAPGGKIAQRSATFAWPQQRGKPGRCAEASRHVLKKTAPRAENPSCACMRDVVRQEKETGVCLVTPTMFLRATLAASDCFAAAVRLRSTPGHLARALLRTGRTGMTKCIGQTLSRLETEH